MLANEVSTSTYHSDSNEKKSRDNGHRMLEPMLFCTLPFVSSCKQIYAGGKQNNETSVKETFNQDIGQIRWYQRDTCNGLRHFAKDGQKGFIQGRELKQVTHSLSYKSPAYRVSSLQSVRVPIIGAPSPQDMHCGGAIKSEAKEDENSHRCRRYHLSKMGRECPSSRAFLTQRACSLAPHVDALLGGKDKQKAMRTSHRTK